jgi:hypothetical protein
MKEGEAKRSLTWNIPGQWAFILGERTNGRWLRARKPVWVVVDVLTPTTKISCSENSRYQEYPKDTNFPMETYQG